MRSYIAPLRNEMVPDSTASSTYCDAYATMPASSREKPAMRARTYVTPWWKSICMTPRSYQRRPLLAAQRSARTALQAVSAVEHQALPGHVARAARREKGDGLADLLGGAEATEGGVALGRREPRLVELALGDQARKE